jgi:release factor glutamine methyltransferase
VPDEDPLLFYRTIGRFALHTLEAGGYLVVETHMDFAVQVKSLFEDLAFVDIELRVDLYGRPRMLMARKKL